ncbi:MAG TPA: T9SS type A sorting domain-containing protein [Puia sp.]|nr:T9SS type A sorting domain-containing protein [Puia sp.]
MRIIAFLILFIGGSSMVRAQHNVFSVGAASTLTILTGTIFSADSLVLIPSSNFTVASNALLETPVAVTGGPFNSINRVYYLNSPITFSGTIKIYYALSELNGNTESLLKYADSTTGAVWLVSGSSAVNLVTHFVQQPATNRIFIAATAMNTSGLLALKLLSFTGHWSGDHVLLEWIVEENEQSASFRVESSPDGRTWKEVVQIPGSMVSGQYKYRYNDQDGAFTTRLYRIKTTELSGQTLYSSIVRVSKVSAVNDLYVVGRNSGATVYFTGMQPKAVRLINAVGQIVWSDNSSRQQYDVNGLMPGAYFVQYELNGRVGVKQFMVQ